AQALRREGTLLAHQALGQPPVAIQIPFPAYGSRKEGEDPGPRTVPRGFVEASPRRARRRPLRPPLRNRSRGKASPRASAEQHFRGRSPRLACTLENGA